MRDRLKSYLRAIEDGTTEKYHDYRDVWSGKMDVKDYVRKWGRYTGCWLRRKDD
ncbi:MAG: hypothetical protein U9P49_06365 [Thermodesulfobacteriota bacterium]|nr:hypothetical protein [Thermodesulfobacteriota bacterium]